MATIGENIKRIRKSKKISQKELAEKTGVSVNSIQGYEYGEFKPKIETVQKIAAALGTSMPAIDERLGEQNGTKGKSGMTVGENIRRIRTDEGLSQKRLADLLGVSSSMIAQYESGKRNPKISTIKKIAAILGCTAGDIDEDLNKTQAVTPAPVFNMDSNISRLLAIALQLNDRGIDKVIEYVGDLSGNSRYKRRVTNKSKSAER